MALIKRYPNRKLYDTEARQYITLKALAKKIQQGEEVQVVDYESGDDLTAVTLSQILLDQHKEESGFLPRSVLAGLIQSGGSRLNSLQRTLTSTLGLNRLVDDEIQRRLEVLVNEGELNPEDAAHLSKQLLSEEVSPPPVQAQIDEIIVEKVLSERGIPSRSEFQQLLDQLETLSGKISDLDKDETRPEP